MDFQQLLAKMQELDAPTQAAPIQEIPVEECGEMPPAPVSAPTAPTNPPSMSVNLNAQGMENIEDLLKLITKVNPDATKSADMPGMAPMPTIAAVKPSLPPLKMLPDMDADNDEKPGGEMDIKIGEPDVMNKDSDEKEEFANEPEEEYKDASFSTHDGNDLNKSKDTFPKVAGADNPMQKNKFESGDLRAQIRAELLQRLAEAKGEK